MMSVVHFYFVKQWLLQDLVHVIYLGDVFSCQIQTFLCIQVNQLIYLTPFFSFLWGSDNTFQSQSSFYDSNC